MGNDEYVEVVEGVARINVAENGTLAQSAREMSGYTMRGIVLFSSSYDLAFR